MHEQAHAYLQFNNVQIFFLKMSFDASKILHLVKHGSLIVENATMNQYRLFRVKIFLHPNIPASCQPILLACG